MEDDDVPTKGSSKQRRATASRRLREIRRSGVRPRAMRWASSVNRGTERDDGACGNAIGATAASGSQRSADREPTTAHLLPGMKTQGSSRLGPSSSCLFRASPSQLRIAWRGRSARCAASPGRLVARSELSGSSSGGLRLRSSCPSRQLAPRWPARSQSGWSARSARSFATDPLPPPGSPHPNPRFAPGWRTGSPGSCSRRRRWRTRCSSALQPAGHRAGSRSGSTCQWRPSRRDPARRRRSRWRCLAFVGAVCVEIAVAFAFCVVGAL